MRQIAVFGFTIAAVCNLMLYTTHKPFIVLVGGIHALLTVSHREHAYMLAY